MPTSLSESDADDRRSKQSCALKDFVIEEHKTSFFLGRETIIPTGKPGMARWREHLFGA
jgi:KUP system potassium uptake protein